jgi:hypothetical protein
MIFKNTTLLLLIGIILLAAGLLFVGQGWGYIRWPARSFMIDETRWIYYGGGFVVAGLVLIIVSRR